MRIQPTLPIHRITSLEPNLLPQTSIRFSRFSLALRAILDLPVLLVRMALSAWTVRMEKMARMGATASMAHQVQLVHQAREFSQLLLLETKELVLLAA
jgi:formate-dependent phosphoribosylglycinamide formyltransferase (GAR transformylase)